MEPMTESVREALDIRNRRIIDAVIARAALVCPGALDLIAITGSFATGDAYERSDLDLLIVIGDDDGYRLAKCFILGEIGFDIYCQKWEQVESAADFSSPYVSKLTDADIVYVRDEACRARFEAACARLRTHLISPVSGEDLSRARAAYDGAVRAYGTLCLWGEDRNAARYAAEILYHLETAVYLINHACVRHGVRGIPMELQTLPSLPDDFCVLHRQLYTAQTLRAVSAASAAILRAVDVWLAAAEREVCAGKPIPDAAALAGSYEEIWSNWRNKMRRASMGDDRYLAVMTMASCQMFYDEMAQAYRMELLSLYEDGWTTASEAADTFNRVMEQYAALYDSAGLEILRYEDMDAFAADYVKKITE